MKIVHVPCAYYPVKGGTEWRTQRVSEILASLGHEVTVLTSDISSISGYFELGLDKLNIKKQEINKVRVIRISYGGLIYKIAGFFSNFILLKIVKKKFTSIALRYCYRKFSRDLCELIKDIKPDIVMTTPHLLPNVTAVIEAHKKSRFPLAIVPCLHEEDQNWPINKMTTALKEGDVILAMTEHEASRIVNAYSVDEEKVIVTRLGVDIPDFNRLRNDKREQKILFLGRKIPKKGIPLLIDAMRLVWPEHPDVKLILAGAREPETKDIDELIDSLPQEYLKNIGSLDDITEQEKSYLLSSSLCLVLPSKIESFGGVILEAWAYATATITFDLPVFRSFVSPGIDGILVPSDNPLALAKAISSIIQNPELRVSLGNAGRRKAEDKFTWEKVAKSYVSAYEYAVKSS